MDSQIRARSSSACPVGQLSGPVPGSWVKLRSPKSDGKQANVGEKPPASIELDDERSAGGSAGTDSEVRCSETRNRLDASPRARGVSGSGVRLESAACSDVGLRRVVNEDNFAIAEDLGLYIVADGMGGHKAGRVASTVAVETTLAAIEVLSATQQSPAEMLRGAVARANLEICNRSEGDPDLEGMGTTLVALLAAGGRIALAHVGDSRAYLVRAGRIRLLTDDHSVVGDLLRRQQITEEAAREHPHRHVLTRALGVAPSIEVDLAELTPMPGDMFILCSDGLTTHLRDSEILEIVMRETLLAKCCDALIAAANQRGGVDNITAMLLRFCDESQD